MKQADFDGQDLRTWREAAGLSRRELAERAECSPGWIELAERKLPRRSFVLPRVLSAIDAELHRKGKTR